MFLPRCAAQTGRRWGKAVIVYGPAGVNKDHNVVKFLTTEGRCTSVQYYKPG